MERGRKEGGGGKETETETETEGARKRGRKGEGRWREWLPKDVSPSDQGPRKGLAAQIWTQSLPTLEPGGSACGVFQQPPGIVHMADLTGRKSMAATEM